MAYVQSSQNVPVNGKEDSLISETVGFIGAGNMAKALIGGFISKGMLKGSQILVSAPSTRNTSSLYILDVESTSDNQKVVEGCDIVFLAVKPNIISDVVDRFTPLPNGKSPLFVSIAAGVSIAKLETLLERSASKPPRVIRVMPNTPCSVMEGCCAYSLGKNALPNDGVIVKKMLSAVGICEEVPESQLNAVGGLAGSGPAYIYAAIEALADGGVKMGLPRGIAMTFAAKTVRGAATMVLETGRHPGQLKDEVCSPSGTTIAAMHSLEKNGFRNSLISAVEASTLRSIELGQTS